MRSSTRIYESMRNSQFAPRDRCSPRRQTHQDDSSQDDGITDRKVQKMADVFD